MTDKYQAYRKKWRTFPRNFTQEKVPVHLDIELTTYCNLRCKMCPLTEGDVPPRHMPISRVSDILKEFGQKGGCSVKLVYLGEPLLYPFLKEAIRIAKQQGIIETILATNGMLLTREKAMGLMDAGLDYVIFSVDSSFLDVYEKIRVGGDLNVVKENLKSFHELREERGSTTPKIQVQAIPMKENFKELESGRYDAIFSPHCDVIRHAPYCMNYVDETPVPPTPSFHCPSPYRRFVIRVDGTIATCCGTRLPCKEIGKFPAMSIEEAWNSYKMKQMRWLMDAGRSHEIPACEHCDHRRRHYHD